MVSFLISRILFCSSLPQYNPFYSTVLTLLYPTLPYPTLPYPTLLYSTLLYSTLLYSYSTLLLLNSTVCCSFLFHFIPIYLPLLLYNLYSVICFMTLTLNYSYEVTSSKFTRDLYKELLVALVASLFLGFGILFLLLWVGIYL